MRRTGCCLLGHEDDAEAAFADLLQQLVRADDRAGPFADGGSSTVATGPASARSQEAAGLASWASQQRFDPRRAGPGRRHRPRSRIGRPLVGSVLLHGLPGRSPSTWLRVCVHGASLSRCLTVQCDERRGERLTNESENFSRVPGVGRRAGA